VRAIPSVNKNLARAIEELARNREEAKRLLRVARPLWAKNRRKTLILDHHTCRMCSFRLCLEVHHVLPLAQGGSDKIANLITLCPNHHAMADRNLVPVEEFARCLARRTAKGRFLETCTLIEQIARESGAIGDDPERQVQFQIAMKAELPRRLELIHGSVKFTADLDSVPLNPLGRG
jgi:hypothetical protein